jgi:pimeloyl-ACP methyl ester carboxylesterase
MWWSVEHGMTIRRFGAGPEVVWLHGLGEQSASFDAIVRHPLLDGYTHVPMGRDSLVQLAEHLAHWLGERGPGERPVLVGHSMGGVLAILVAERVPVAGVVDVDGNLSRGDCSFSAQVLAYSREDFVAHGFAAMRARVYERGLIEPALRGYHAALALACPELFHTHAIDLVAMSTQEVLAERLAALSVPTLFVAGVPGGICARSKALLDAYGVRWVGIEPAGHWPHVDQPDAFAAAVLPVLRAASYA